MSWGYHFALAKLGHGRLLTSTVAALVLVNVSKYTLMLWQADPSLLPEVEEDVMTECTKIGAIERLRVRYIRSS